MTDQYNPVRDAVVNTSRTRALSWIDLQFLGRPHADRRPASCSGAGRRRAHRSRVRRRCLETLELGLQAQGIRLSDVTHMLLTHIHLDHAGATGTIVRAPSAYHACSCTSAARRTWSIRRSCSRARRGCTATTWIGCGASSRRCPRRTCVSLAGGERIEAGGRTFEVAYTPGHASHHVSYFDRVERRGVRRRHGGRVHRRRLRAAADAAARHRPRAVAAQRRRASRRGRRHAVPDALRSGDTTSGRTCRRCWRTCRRWRRSVRESLDGAGTDEEQRRAVRRWLRRELRRQMTEAQVGVVRRRPRRSSCLWLGLARYWRKTAGSRRRSYGVEPRASDRRLRSVRDRQRLRRDAARLAGSTSRRSA